MRLAACLSVLALQQPPVGVINGLVRSPVVEPAGTVVYLAREPSENLELATDTILIDQRELAFVPSVQAILPGTSVFFRNSDPVLHNVFSPAGPGPGFDLGTYPRPGGRTHRFLEPGVHVILCHVHPEMLAYVIVVATRYRAVAGADGTFSIRDVPPGRYRLHAWRRRTEPLERELQLRPGETLELELELAPARRRKG